MWHMGIFLRKPAPLTGAPAVRRIKSYAAESGYVYEYYYAGQRPWRDRLGGGVEFEFHVSAPGARWLPATVIVADRELRVWETLHRRTLSATERYAIAKLALFASFDRHAAPPQTPVETRVSADEVENIARNLEL
jgi:hypothetical protein